METLGQYRDKIVIGILVLVILAVGGLVYRRITPAAPQIRPGQTLDDPLGTSGANKNPTNR